MGSFSSGDWDAKIGSQEINGVTGKFDLVVQNEAGQRLTESYRENALVTANILFQQPKRPSTHGHHQMVKTERRLCSLWPMMRSSIQSAKTIPGADCGSDHEFLITKLRLKLKKVEKTTRPFRYNLN